MSVVEDTAHLSELALLQGNGGALQMIAKIFDLLLGILAAAGLIAEGHTDHQAEGDEDEPPGYSDGCILAHSDFSRVVGYKKYLGFFNSPENAARRYDEEAKKLKGVNPVLNFPHEMQVISAVEEELIDAGS